jgi:phage terminase large subunit
MVSCLTLNDIESWERVELPIVYDLSVENTVNYYIDCDKPILVHNSGKSYGIIQCLIYLAQTTPGIRISVVSHSLPHIKRGAFRDFRLIMHDWGLWDDGKFSYTDFIFTFENGSYIELFGLEDESKARGPGRDILFVNEANLIKKTLFDQLAMRTTGQILIDLNPADLECWCYDLADNTSNKCIHSTYKDNKIYINGQWQSNLSQTQISYIEAYKDGDPYMWEVYGLGMRGRATDIIYTHWKLCPELPMKGELFMGCDFGYNVPTSLVLCELYEGSVYVKEIIYQTKLTTTDLIYKFEDVGVSKTIQIFCDNAEPKTIEEIRRAGYNAWEADKDVTEGIRRVKSMPLFITENSSNIVKEIKSYKWRTDVNGKVIKDKDRDEPVKLNDHAMDAMRYAIFTKLYQPHYSWVAM